MTSTLGGFFLPVLVFLYLIGIPSTQAAGFPSLQDVLLDWDAIDPAEDKELLPQSDDQPDAAGDSWLPLADSCPRLSAPADAPQTLFSLRPSSRGTRAPPVL